MMQGATQFEIRRSKLRVLLECDVMINASESHDLLSGNKSNRVGEITNRLMDLILLNLVQFIVKQKSVFFKRNEKRGKFANSRPRFTKERLKSTEIRNTDGNG